VVYSPLERGWGCVFEVSNKKANDVSFHFTPTLKGVEKIENPPPKYRIISNIIC